MEEECLIEKRRTIILKECRQILQEEGAGRYNKEAFRRLFQDQVRIRNARNRKRIKTITERYVCALCMCVCVCVCVRDCDSNPIAVKLEIFVTVTPYRIDFTQICTQMKY